MQSQTRETARKFAGRRKIADDLEISPVHTPSLQNIPEYVFANQAGLRMLESTEDSLPGLPWEKTIPESEREIAYKDLFQILHQGYSYIPAGVRVSSKGRAVAFERAVAWDVLDGNSNTDFVAIMFMNWSFLQ